jgi:hypothetical protein
LGRPDGRLARFLLAAPLGADAPEPAGAYRRFLACAAGRLCETAPVELAASPRLAEALLAGLASVVVDCVESGGAEGLRPLAPRLSSWFVIGLRQIGATAS